MRSVRGAEQLDAEISGAPLRSWRTANRGHRTRGSAWRRLLADTGTPGCCRSVALERLVVDHLVRPQPEPFVDPGDVIHVVFPTPGSRRHQADARRNERGMSRSTVTIVVSRSSFGRAAAHVPMTSRPRIPASRTRGSGAPSPPRGPWGTGHAGRRHTLTVAFVLGVLLCRKVGPGRSNETAR